MTKNIKKQVVSTTELRNAGWSLGAVAALISLWPLIMRGETPYVSAATLAAILLCCASFFPSALARPYSLWMRAASAIGNFNTRIILTALYFLAIVPVSYFLRIFKKLPIKVDFDSDAESYRESPGEESSSSMENQY